jgi:hypothetical protein
MVSKLYIHLIKLELKDLKDNDNDIEALASPVITQRG